MMYELVQPKYIMPVHGSLTFRYQNKKNYVGWGHDPNKVLLTEDGMTWEFTGKDWKRGSSVESKPILIDGLGVGDIGDVVLKDRKQLSQYGMFVVIMNISRPTKRLIGNLKFISRGFVYMKASQKLLREIENNVKDVHRKWYDSERDKKRLDERVLMENVEKDVSRYIKRKTEREPIVLPVVI